MDDDGIDGHSNRVYKTWILIIEDRIAYLPGNESNSTKSLPEVLINGRMHGNKKVGPTVVVELAFLLLESAHCE